MRWPRHRRAWLAPAVLAGVVTLTAVPFLLGRYPFLLDFVAGPNWDPLRPRLYGFHTPVYGAKLPLLALLSVLPPDLAAKALLPGVLVLAAVVGYATLPGPRWARLYGALVLVVNPFVYARVLAGQWAVVWGLAMVPLVLATFAAYLEEPGPRRLVAAVGAITLLAVSAHLLYAAAILLGLVTVFRYVEVRDRAVGRRALSVVLAALPVNAFWLVPALLDGSAFARLSPADLAAYAPHVGSSPPLFATASMHGFWRRGYVYARDLVPAVEFLFVVVLFLAIYGAVSRADGERGYVVRALAATAVVAVLLGAGLRGPAAPAFAWLAEHVPLFVGMRDSNKFVALLVVAYASLGARGIAALRRDLDRVEWEALVGDRLRRATVGGDGADRPTTVGRFGATALVPALVVGLLVLSPLVYTFPMVTGYAGQVSVGDYPDEWDEVEAFLAADDGDDAVLVLPWHGYVDLSWLDGPHRRVRMPARHVFSVPVVQGDTVELGPIYSTSRNLVSRHVEATFGLGSTGADPTGSNVGAALAEANVGYVLLTKEADWRAYEAVLAEQRDLSLRLENDRVALYRVDRPAHRAYATDRLADREGSAVLANGSRTASDAGDAGDDRGARNATGVAGVRDPLATVEHSPVTAEIEGTDRAYTTVALDQRAAGPGWRYGGEPPAATHRGVRPAFPSSADGAELTYAPFARLYLPSYVLSAVAVVLLAGYWLLARTNPVPGTGRWRTPARRIQDDD